MIPALLIIGLVLALAAGLIAVDAELAGEWDEESRILAWLGRLWSRLTYRGQHRSPRRLSKDYWNELEFAA